MPDRTETARAWTLKIRSGTYGMEVEGPHVEPGAGVRVVALEDAVEALKEQAQRHGLANAAWPGQMAVEWCADFIESHFGEASK